MNANRSPCNSQIATGKQLELWYTRAIVQLFGDIYVKT